MPRLAALALTAAPLAMPSVVADVRTALDAGDLARAESVAAACRATHGDSPECIFAQSWLSRGALSLKQYDKAEAYAAETRRLVAARLKTHKLDDDKEVPLALGAAVEVQAQVKAARGERAEAVSLLKRDLATYGHTSIRARLQKNLNLLTMEGKPAPAIVPTETLGPPLPSLKGHPTLLFFWAHWCADCKQEASVLARLQKDHPGLVLIGPTQRYGYQAGGEDATPADELRYIDEVRRKYYASLASMPVPISASAFTAYGASTTPTLVLLDRQGVVRLYHPGNLTYDELSARIKALS